MAVVRLFAQARQQAGTGTVELPGSTVGEVIEAVVARFGATFGAVVATSAIWLNGEATDAAAPVGSGDEIAVLPPVSGGSGECSAADG